MGIDEMILLWATKEVLDTDEVIDVSIQNSWNLWWNTLWPK